MDTDLIKKTIFGKYKVLKVIGKGSFGMIFKGKNILTKELVAIKAEDWKIKGDYLESEAYFLYYLKNFGIPEIKSFGLYKKYKILIQSLLGDNLENIFKNDEINLNFKDICMIAIQLIDRLEFIHSKYVIHRDIKPENLLIDLETGTIIYLIDFGMAKKYRSGKTKKHIKFAILNRFNGTLRYSSINATRGIELSRRDDLESAGYVLIYLSQRRYLPWMNLPGENKKEKYINNYKMKKTIKEEELCKYLPKQFCDYMKYVKNLKFEEDPDYNYLRWLFINLLITIKCKNDLKFSWNLNNKKNSRNTSYSKSQVNDLLLKRKTSPYSRILRNIKNSKEKENKMNNIETKKIDDIIEEKSSEKRKGVSENNKSIKISELPFKKDNLNINQNPNKIDKEKRDNTSDFWTKMSHFDIDINIKDLEGTNSNNADEKNNKKIKPNDKLEFKYFKNIENKNKNIYINNKKKYEKIIFTYANNSPKKNNKLNILSESVNKINNVLNIDLDKKYKDNKLKEKRNLYLDSYYSNTSFNKNINKIPLNTNSPRMNNFSTNHDRKLESKKNSLNRIEIPKDIQRKKINYNFKNFKERKKTNLQELSFNNIKYNLTYNNSGVLNKKQNPKRFPINYNKVIIKNSAIERKMSYNQIPIIRTFSYRKFFTRSNSIKEFKNIKRKSTSPLNNPKHPNSEYHSVIKTKSPKNRIKEYRLANSEKLINLKQNRIQSYENKNKKDNMIIFDFNPFNERLLSNPRRKMLSDNKTNKFNNIKVDQPANLNIGKRFIYKRPNKFVINMKNIPQINTTTSNINIKQNFIFPFNNYLNNSSSYKNIIKRNINYFPYSTSNY